MGWVHELNSEKAEPAPVSLPRFNLDDIDVEREAREAAERLAQRRVLRNGLDAWRAIGKAESLEAWLKIGAALHVGKLRAIRVTRSNSGWGAAYSREFGRWMREYGFGTMPKAVRSWAIALHENAKAIEQWRQGLPERERKRLINPQSVVKRWQRATQHGGNGKCPQDFKRDALAAWRKFCDCVAMLPPDQAAPLWQAAYAQAAAMAHV
jgi:hypothetical protein